MGIAIPSHFTISGRIHLLSGSTGVIHVIAVATAKGKHMNTPTTEENENTQTTATGEKPKATKKARVAKRGAPVAPKKAKSNKKAKSLQAASHSLKAFVTSGPQIARVTRKVCRESLRVLEH